MAITEIIVRECRLTDGSTVFDVELQDARTDRNGPKLVIPAVTESDATALAEKIALALHEHTNESFHSEIVRL